MDPGRRTDASRPSPAHASLALRAGVACVWLATGVLVLHPYYRAVGTSYLDRIHLPAWLMWSTCAAEVGIAVAVVAVRAWSLLTVLQLGMVATFTLILSVADPMLLASPFGVLTKNVPLVAALIAAALLEREGWSPRATWVLRAGMAVIWLTEGLVPKILFQQDVELGIAVGSGLSFGHPQAMLRVIGAAQILGGLAALLLSGRALAAVLAAQALSLVILPIWVSTMDPTLWFHPFGPLTKNAPILAGTLVLLRRAMTTGEER